MPMRALCNIGRTLTRKQKIYLDQEYAVTVMDVCRSSRSGKINVYNLTERLMNGPSMLLSVQLALGQWVYDT